MKKNILLGLFILIAFKATLCSDTLYLKSVEVYQYPRSVQVRLPLDEKKCIEFVKLRMQQGDHSVFVDTISDILRLIKIDSVCRQNKYLKSEIEDSVNRYKSLKGGRGDIRLVIILNYNHKRIIIGLNKFIKSMMINDKKYKIKKELYDYFVYLK